MDEDLMSIMMTLSLDRMEMEAEVEIQDLESTLDAIPVNVTKSGNPTLELSEPLTEQLTEQETVADQSDAPNVKVWKPAGSKKQLTWLIRMWAIALLNIRE